MKRLNPRRVKIHRSYTIGEVAHLFAVHKNTVRNWIEVGLPSVDGRRPTLILGRELASFLHSRRMKRKLRCRPGEMYCFKCRAPRPAAHQLADYIPYTSCTGNLRALCACCGIQMFRRVSWLKVNDVAGPNTVQVLETQQRLRGTSTPSVNCDLEKETNRAVAQSRK